MTVTPRAAGDILTAAIFNTKIESPVLSGELGAGAVDAAALAAGAVTPDKIGTITWTRIYHNTTQAIPNDASTALTFNSEQADPEAMHSTSTYPTRLTAPRQGVYVLGGTVAFASNATGFRQLAIRVNGSVYIAVSSAVALATTAHPLSLATLYGLGPTDYAELLAYQNSGGSLNVTGASDYQGHFWAARIGGA